MKERIDLLTPLKGIPVEWPARLESHSDEFEGFHAVAGEPCPTFQRGSAMCDGKADTWVW
jgi:hypothetical protein